MSNVSNEELVNKAVITADALATNGKLNPAQADKFIDYVIDETALKDQVRVVRFRNEQLDIDKIGIGKRVLMPKEEGRDPGKRRGVSTSKIKLQPKEVMGPFEIGDNFREHNLEGDSVEDRIIRMMATQIANDLEEAEINGNKLGPARTQQDMEGAGSSSQYVKDSFIGLVDGWSVLAESGHIVDAEGANIGLSIFGKAIRAMPTKYRRNPNALRWLLSPDLAQLYAEKMSSRNTAAGDEAAKGNTFGPFGIKMLSAALWPLNPRHVEHVVLNSTTAVALKHANVKNVVVTPSDLADVATAAYSASTDYTLDAAAGTVARKGGGTIADGATVKVTYEAPPQIILTHMSNLVLGIGREIRIEKDRDIFKGMNQYAVTCKFDVQFEEVDAVVKVKNIGDGI